MLRAFKHAHAPVREEGGRIQRGPAPAAALSRALAEHLPAAHDHAHGVVVVDAVAELIVVDGKDRPLLPRQPLRVPEPPARRVLVGRQEPKRRIFPADKVRLVPQHAVFRILMPYDLDAHALRRILVKPVPALKIRLHRLLRKARAGREAHQHQRQRRQPPHRQHPPSFVR